MLDICRNCPLYKPGMPNYVPPTIPSPADYKLYRILMIGEAPGEEEVKQGKGFVGQSGQELDAYLRRAKVPRKTCIVTNLVRCRPPDNRDPTNEEVSCCSQHLEDLLVQYKPQVVIAVGRYAARWFIPSVNMELHHGLPIQVQGRTVIPAYHPSFGLRQTHMMTVIAQDYKMVRQVIDNEVRPRELEGKSLGLQYEEITTVADFWKSVSLGSTLAVDTESEVVGSQPDPFKDKLWCITYSPDGKYGYMLRKPHLWQEFGCCVNKDHRTTVLHNAPYDLAVLASVGVYPKNVEDTMQMAYLLQDVPMGLKALAYRLCGINMRAYKDVVGKHGAKKALEYILKASMVEWPKPPVQVSVEKGQLKYKQPQGFNKIFQRALNDYAKNPELDLYSRWIGRKDRKIVEDRLGPMPQGNLDDVPLEQALEYACKDAIATYRVYPMLKRRIEVLGLGDAYRRDISIIPAVMDIMHNGMKIRPEHFRGLSKDFTVELDKLQREASRLYTERTGKERIINPNSPPDVSNILFEMGIFKKRGLSTAQEMLDRYKSNPRHAPMIKCISSYREYKKLKGTYSDVLPTLVDENDRIHTKISMTRAVTGRLASSNPNLMNQPTSSAIGREIRAGFIPEPGWVYVSLDYSQIEMRKMADAAQDELMCQMFRDGADIHSETAARMFKIPLNQVDKEKHRYPAKRVSFGIIYGISEIGLHKQMVMEGLDYTKDDCAGLLQSWFNVYRGIRRYISELSAEARRTGMVRDMFGRYRLVPEVYSSQPRIIGAGLRQACNAPIQGGAQGIIKEAMKMIVPVLRKYGDVCKLVMQIHDDLLFEVREDKVEELVPLIQVIMENAVKLSVPTPVDPKVGRNWRDLVGYEEFLQSGG